MVVTTFTIEANDISDAQRNRIEKLLEHMMKYSGVDFEPLADGSMVHTEIYNYGDN
jgi:hypothetical protein